MKVGILGGGQLGDMLAQAAKKLNIEPAVYDPAPDCSARFNAKHFCHSYNDYENLRKFADWADIITYEFENVPLLAVEFLSLYKNVSPPINSLHYTQDRLQEKMLLNKLGIETTDFREINNEQDLYKAAGRLCFPFYLKTRSGGYDGKGQWKINSIECIENFNKDLLGKGLIAEKGISFDVWT